MKLTFSISIVVIAFLAQSCLTPYSTATYDYNQRICNIPTVEHLNPINVVYNPHDVQDHYFEIKWIDITRHSTEGRTIGKAQKIARAYGADAILVWSIEDLTTTSETYCEETGETMTSTNHKTRVQATAVKYTKNVDYLNDIVKRVHIDVYDHTTGEYIQNVETVSKNLRGETQEHPSTIPLYLQQVYACLLYTSPSPRDA